MSDGGLSRRDAAATLVTALPLLAPAALQGAPDQLGFGLIGAGAWGQTLLRHANTVSTARCVAVCDLDQEAARKAASSSRDHPAVFADHRRLLERPDVQAVLIATPHHTHASLTRDALLAARHVHCEPPVAFRFEEIQLLRATAERVDRVVQVGLPRRYSRFYQVALQMAAKGFLGDVTAMQAQWHRSNEPALDPARPREKNWKYFRQYSGGLTAELGAHQFDVASWLFRDTPDFVTGVGALDWRKDGRDVYDTVSLIFRYPEGRQMTWSSLSTNHHLPAFGGARVEAGEVLLGTEGTIELSLGTDDQPALALWFYEPSRAKVSTPEAAREIAKVAGATVTSTPEAGSRGLPILLDRDQLTGEESFLQRELKYARRWLYAKGIMIPEENRHPVAAALESFFECCREGKRPKANLEAGLTNATHVLLANRALDEARRIPFPSPS